MIDISFDKLQLKDIKGYSITSVFDSQAGIPSRGIMVNILEHVDGRHTKGLTSISPIFPIKNLPFRGKLVINDTDGKINYTFTDIDLELVIHEINGSGRARLFTFFYQDEILKPEDNNFRKINYTNKVEKKTTRDYSNSIFAQNNILDIGGNQVPLLGYNNTISTVNDLDPVERFVFERADGFTFGGAIPRFHDLVLGNTQYSIDFTFHNSRIILDNRINFKLITTESFGVFNNGGILGLRIPSVYHLAKLAHNKQTLIAEKYFQASAYLPAVIHNPNPDGQNFKFLETATFIFPNGLDGSSMPYARSIV